MYHMNLMMFLTERSVVAAKIQERALGLHQAESTSGIQEHACEITMKATYAHIT